MDVIAPAVPETDLMRLLSWSSHALLAELTAALAEIGITPRAHCVLYKATLGDKSQSQLADEVGLDKTTMVVLMDKLEKDGLAERRLSSVDRRARVIHVTDKGRDAVAKAQVITAEVNDEVLSSLSAELRDSLLEALSQLAEGRLATIAHCDHPPRRRSTRSA